MERKRVVRFGIGLLAVVGGILALRFVVGSASALMTPGLRTRAVEGTIVALELKAPQPSLDLQKADGQVMTLKIEPNAAADPNATLVSQEKQVVPLDNLEKGQRVKVRYTADQEGGVAKYIEIVDPLPMMKTGELPWEKPGAAASS